MILLVSKDGWVKPIAAYQPLRRIELFIMGENMYQFKPAGDLDRTYKTTMFVLVMETRNWQTPVYVQEL